MQKSASCGLELHIQKYWEDSVTMLALAQESEKSKETTMLSERTKISYKNPEMPISRFRNEFLDLQKFWEIGILEGEHSGR
jgi:hypothetical protein